MSENLEDLLEGSADEENEDEYDLADDEEDALLEENFEGEDTAHLEQPSKEGNAEAGVEQEQDFVLDLDDETELNDDEDSEILNSTAEEEQDRCRKDKFANERVLPQHQTTETEQQNMRNNLNNFNNGWQSAVGNYRGRGRTRGNYRNIRVRTVQVQRKKVHINPHFQGNVEIKNNVSLAWDNNQRAPKKPLMYIQPWANNHPVGNNILPPQQEAQFMPDVYSMPYQQPPMQQVNARLPVHQRLGLNQCNDYNNIPNNQQHFIQTVHQPPLFETPPPPLNNNYCNLSQFSCPTYQTNLPINQPPVYNNQCGGYPSNNFNPNINYPPFVAPAVHLQQQPHVNDYQHNISVANVVPFNYTYVENKNENFNNNRRFIQGIHGKRKYDFKNDLKKKKRNLPSSNLHEVLTVDTPTFFEEKVPEMLEEEDEEMRAYRLKIDQQKKIREKILRQKEERRKQAAKKLQADEEYKSVVPPNELIKHEEIPVITNVKLESKSAVVVKKKPPVSSVVNKNIVPIKTVGDAQVVRIVKASPLKTDGAVQTVDESLNANQLSSFLSNRKIFAKDQSLPDTSIVIINNLATGTSELKLRKLCQAVGDIQNLQMSPQERQATVQFKSVASAHAFYKKYQRFMLDLSMIQVSLKPAC